MHTVVVDIAIQGDSAKASASHFHTVVPFHNLLTIWFSFGQTVLRSAFRVIGIIPSLFLLMYSQVILSDEKPALSFFKELYIFFSIRGDKRRSTTLFLKNRETFGGVYGTRTRDPLRG